MVDIPSILKLIVTVVFLSTLPTQVHALTPAQVFDKVKDSVVVVKTLDVQGKVKQGSGVLIPSGKIATNCHVVEGGISYQVSRGKQLFGATLYAKDGDKDICLLDAKGITGKPAQLGKAADLKVGVPVYAVGAPEGLELSLSEGIVAQLRFGPPPLIQTTAAISHGSSGGGLFDREGRLVGLTKGYVEGGQSLNFALPVEWIGEIKPVRKTVAKGHSPPLWWERSFALWLLEDWQGMLDWSRLWTEKERYNPDAWFSLGEAYSRLNLHNDAIEAYRFGLRINPKDISDWNNLGLAYMALNRYNESIEAYRQALRIDPKHANSWYNLGNAYDELMRYDDATEAYRKAVRINPKKANVWNNLGITYGQLNRHGDAIEAHRQAVRIDPKDATCWYNLGNAYVSLKRYNDAVDAYLQAVRINPKDDMTLNNLAIAYTLSGNKTAALEAVQELRRLDPEKADKLFNRIVPR